jgi:hypothetical protein
MQQKKKLPIGIQTFENLIEEGYCYVDKTAHIAGFEWRELGGKNG